ncbi:alpha/beta hydrolase family protein [Quisquiliibacterium transsilvanicum]|uniref:Dipeptidyl aminopeptidase/acylaminoacyl peptidase n=1 Tax=Quisquiliibacterium transsilvanicum TaxID=1549638 RepID=A0A7W8HGJ5_9BURK|nr:alpha/beta fold hydrolase [Quisquiliibacterium transsilvanicum]MBB5270810.1 dipeptidyl aminopeptidase/acylaminoacyl peptidase [Quisquiliibacterium transsilvanicum]
MPTPAPDSRRLAPGRADSHSPLAWPLRALRPLLHRALLRGLRAPRLAHDPPIAQLAQLAQGTRHALRLETLRLRGARGQTLAAWLLTQDLRGPAHASATSATSATREPSAQPLPAVLAMHGWGANASTLWPAVDPLLAAGFAVMLVDASCHGESGDEDFTSLPRFAEDIATALEALCAHPAVDRDRIALLGHSVGAGAALLHAARSTENPAAGPCPVRAVVSLSAFAHPAEMMQRWMAEHRIPRRVLGNAILGHVQQVIGERFERIAPVNTIAALACPVLLVHGRHDTTVPMADALRLRDAQPRAELLVVDADHDLRAALAPQGARIVAFLQRALG